ncbi:MAG: 23S rRNA (adenine(2503)-C(2))-methyltransferase RlmN, partial [Clostridia bacterium]|nr:23S rRNA (adenine(2503)-C(2))-methyltransferase RlmN [Clostridia bacterium]
QYHLGTAKLLKKQISRRGEAQKYLLELADEQTVETVLMYYDYGASVCLSSQVGCSMNCAFCASAQGRIRNLTNGELLEQVLTAQREGQTRISRLVLMGTGEPLENLEEVLKFLAKLPDLGISLRHLTLSTCGLVPGIEKLKAQNLPITLAISLHAPEDQLRSRLMPINRRYPLAELLAAADSYANSTKRRITYEYIMLREVNDRLEQAEQLADLLRGRLAHVNLISYNPVQDKKFRPSEPTRINRFKAELERKGISVTVRRKLGLDIDAACGQLRRRSK